jgi:4-hydroxy-2-oxoglutarate aldolase
VVSAAPEDFYVLTGGAGVVYPALAMGARGAILALACALPEKCVELYELFQQNRHAEARALQHVLVNASKRIVSEHGIPGLKYVMQLRGYHGGVPRLPLLPVKEEKKHQLAAILGELHPAAARV